MRLSLNSHPEQYEFFEPMFTKGFRTLFKLPLLTRVAIGLPALLYSPVLMALFGGCEFARRHVYVADLSHSKSEKAWHWCVAGIEVIPVLGTLIALVESVVTGLGALLKHKEYRPLWSEWEFWSVPHWLLISSIKKDTKLDDLKGCDFDKTEGGDMAILCAAAYVGNTDLIHDLIPTMSEFTSAYYHSPLIYAIEGRQNDVLKALLEQLPNVQEHLNRRTLAIGSQNARPYPSVTPLYLVAQKLQDVSLVKPLLQVRIPTDDPALAAQGIGAQGKAVIERAAQELAEERRLVHRYIEDTNVIDFIITGY